MKKFAIIMTLLLGAAQIQASDSCNNKVTFDYDVVDSQGTVMRMVVKDENAFTTFASILPYSDCYKGVCTSNINAKKKEITINFTSERANGFHAYGVYANYSTFKTKKGIRLDIDTEYQSASFLFEGCDE